jgi:hypothetical protein
MIPQVKGGRYRVTACYLWKIDFLLEAFLTRISNIKEMGDIGTRAGWVKF